MDRSQAWVQCVRVIIDALLTAPRPAAREVGHIWEWAFSRLEANPQEFNALQTRVGRRGLVQEFIRTCERRSQGETVSDAGIVNYTLGRSLPLEEAPVSQQISGEVANALAAFGMFLGHEGNNTIDSPSRFPYTVALFGFHEHVLRDILESKRIPTEQRDILLEVAMHIPRGDIQREYFRRCEAAARIERFFGFSTCLLSATDVYQRGLDFYQSASRTGPRSTLTFSNTSGIWNPLERGGTAEFLRKYGLREGGKLAFKDGFRATNFEDGILNPALACRRVYVFNEQDTWNAFTAARNAAKDVTAFDKEAQRLVEQACARMESATGTLHLVAVRNWGALPPLALVTRASENTLMFSNRGSDLSISHAFWCNLGGAGEKREQRLRAVSDVLSAIADLMAEGKLTALASLGRFLEALFGTPHALSKLKDRFAGERMRRLLDKEPSQVILSLKDEFGLELEYVTAPMLRAELKRATERPAVDGNHAPQSDGSKQQAPS